MIGIALLVALVAVVVLMIVARRAGAIPNQRKTDQADGSTSMHDGDGGNGGGD